MARHASAHADKSSPLRKVIDWGTGLDPNPAYYMLNRLLLECGHVVRYPSGAWTDEYSFGTRRRCIKCAEDKPVDWPERRTLPS